MLTFKDNEKEIQNDFCFHVGAIYKLLQYKQIQDWLKEVGFGENRQKQLYFLSEDLIEALKKKAKDE